MSRDRISNVDLNLLHVLLVVLETRSATRAAARLHVTQSAVSSALRRARALFGDALFTREARGLAPTARGAALLAPLRAWVDEADDAVDRALAAHGLTREVRYAVPHFTSLPLVVAETNAVATLGRRVAEAFARRHPLRVFDHPLALPPMTIRQVWHRRADDDPGLAFLRAQMRAAADDTPPRAVTPRRGG